MAADGGGTDSVREAPGEAVVVEDELPNAAERRQIFGTAAAQYDRIRPGYPPELVDAVLEHCGGPAVPALEAGAGTGKATLAFAARGTAITAVEPDPHMAAVLAANCAGRPDVRVVVSRFEDYRPAGRFGLVFSAQAWHWLDPAARCQRTAAALAPGGTLALFWNHDHIPDRELDAAVARAHHDIAPDLGWDYPPLDESALMDRPPGPELAGFSSFEGANARLLRWERTLSRQGYLDFLGTHSLYLLLDAQVRAALFARIAEALPDPLTVVEETVLYLARRTGEAGRLLTSR